MSNAIPSRTATPASDPHAGGPVGGQSATDDALIGEAPTGEARTTDALASEPRDHIACARPAHTRAVAHLGRALSDPTRAAILLALRHGSHCPADLAAELGVSRQSMSNHLTCLRGCGLVVAERRGRHAHYSLADPALASALGALLSVTVTLDPDCCEGEVCSC